MEAEEEEEAHQDSLLNKYVQKSPILDLRLGFFDSYFWIYFIGAAKGYNTQEACLEIKIFFPTNASRDCPGVVYFLKRKYKIYRAAFCLLDI